MACSEWVLKICLMVFSAFLRDTFVVCSINTFTSFYAAVIIFSILGFMAHEKGVEIADVVKSGPGLAFLVFPEVIPNPFTETQWCRLMMGKQSSCVCFILGGAPIDSFGILVGSILYDALGFGIWLSILHLGITDCGFGGQLAGLSSTQTAQVYHTHGHLYVSLGCTHDHKRKLSLFSSKHAHDLSRWFFPFVLTTK